MIFFAFTKGRRDSEMNSSEMNAYHHKVSSVKDDTRGNHTGVQKKKVILSKFLAALGQICTAESENDTRLSVSEQVCTKSIFF